MNDTLLRYWWTLALRRAADAGVAGRHLRHRHRPAVAGAGLARTRVGARRTAERGAGHAVK